MTDRGLLAGAAFLLVGVAALNAGAIAGGGLGPPEVPEPSSTTPSTPTPSPAVDAAAPPPRAPLPVFAGVAGVRLRLPREDVRLVAFHEASLAGARAMRPVGRCAPCRHPGFRPGPAADPVLRYAVMDPRGRPWPPTTAVDLVVREGTVLRSPVTGVVRVSRPYRLYDRYWDHRLAIVPDGAVGVEVIVLHLRGSTLSPGDRVVASVTPLGVARSLPFTSQVDRYVAGDHPHAHLEVVDAEARREAKERARRGAG